jgi:hypothetical protein
VRRSLDNSFLNHVSNSDHEIRPRKIIGVPDADGAAIAIEDPSIDLGWEEVEASGPAIFIELINRSHDNLYRAVAEFGLYVMHNEICSLPSSGNLITWEGFYFLSVGSRQTPPRVKF